MIEAAEELRKIEKRATSRLGQSTFMITREKSINKVAVVVRYNSGTASMHTTYLFTAMISIPLQPYRCGLTTALTNKIV